MKETIKRPGLPRLTREARAALTGIGIAVMLMAAVAIRFTTSSPVGTSLARATRSTHATAKVWVIHTGQTLDLVAAATGLSVAAIEQLNPQTDPGELIPGQRLRLNAAAPSAPSRP
jgi:LysM repeat protein